jgi:O-acetylhomoserine (thiol)-lyase
VWFIEVQFLSHLANVGDAKTLDPSGIDDAPAASRQQRAAGVTPEMIRLSIGLETLDDILWDIDQALARSQR